MDPRLEPIMQNLMMATHVIGETLPNITDEDLDYRISDNNTSLAWVITHTIHARFMMARLAGADVPEYDWEATVQRGAEFDPNAEYPNAETLRELWGQATAAVSAAVPTMTTEQFNAPSPYELPIPDATLGNFIILMASHEWYHLGQIGLMNKAVRNAQILT